MKSTKGTLQGVNINTSSSLLKGLKIGVGVCFLIIFFSFVFLPSAVLAQPADINQEYRQPQSNRTKIYELANTAGQESYLSESEKTVVLLMNLARLDGPYFASQYLGFYADTSSLRYKELWLLLHKQAPRQPLRPAFGLFRSATMHAMDMGSSGLSGTESSDGSPFYDRIHKQLPGAGGYASNFLLGTADPLEAVLTFLVAEEDSLLPYRYNILSSQVDFVGVSIRPHSKNCAGTVIDFARRPAQVPLAKANRHPKTDIYWMDCPKGSKVAQPVSRKRGFWHGNRRKK